MNKISSVIRFQFPEFVQFDGPAIIPFIEAFYQFLEEQPGALYQLENFQKNLDPDTCDDDFLKMWFFEMAEYFPENILIDKRELIKIIKEFYLAKGSEKAFRFLFTVLYDESSINFEYPREFIFSPSNNTFKGDLIAYITAKNLADLDLKNTKILNADITGKTTGAVGIINSITLTTYASQVVYILDISSRKGTFEIGETVTFNVNDKTYDETIYGLVNGLIVSQPGSGYTLDDSITVTGGTGNRLNARIKRISKGSLDQYAINSTGLGYRVGDFLKARDTYKTKGHSFLATVEHVGELGEIQKIRIINPGYDYDQFTKAQVITRTGNGADIDLYGNDIGKILEIEILESGIGYQYSDTLSITIDSLQGTGAEIQPVFDCVFETPRRFRNEKGFTSHFSRLLDSYYYQYFSYAISTNIPPQVWLKTIKNLNHAIESELFPIYRHEIDFDALVSIPSEMDFIVVTITRIFERETLYTAIFSENPDTTRTVYSMVIDTEGSFNLSDLDEYKFLNEFNWSIGTFDNVSLLDIEKDKPMSQILSSQITVT